MLFRSLYTRQGSYDTVWIITLLLGVAAALVNLPINESPIARTAPAPAPA